MKVICAGLPKTGTKSMANAFRMLGFVAHDGPEHFRYYTSEYDQVFSTGKLPDFALMYSKIDVVLDAPACLFWKELKETFPDAKVILMERDSAEVWVKSLLGTITVFRGIVFKPWILLCYIMTPIGRKYLRIFQGITNMAGLDPPNPESNLQKSYLQHNARVKASIPRDDLLVYNVKQGWTPLCDFFGVDVPDVPFPILNIKSDMIVSLFDPMYENIYSEMVPRITVFFILLLAILILFVFIYMWF